MARKISFAVVSLFWLVMMGLLVRRQMQISPDEAFYREFVKMGLSDDEIVMDIYWNGERTGESRTSHVLSESGGTIHNEAFLSLEGIGDVSVSTMARVDRDFKLRHLLADITYEEKRVCVVGQADGDDINVTVTGWGPKKIFRVPNPGAMAFASGPFPALAVRDLRVGAEWDMPLFDFAFMKVERGRARVAGKQGLLWAGKLRDCYRIVLTDALGRKMLTGWCDTGGRLLKMEFAGVKFVRRPDEN